MRDIFSLLKNIFLYTNIMPVTFAILRKYIALIQISLRLLCVLILTREKLLYDQWTSDCWVVGPAGRRTNTGHVSPGLRSVGSMGCRTNGSQDQQALYFLGLSELAHVCEVPCHHAWLDSWGSQLTQPADPASSLLKIVNHQNALRNIMFHYREWSTCLLNWGNIWLFIYMA